jgi:anthranilate synthase component 1
MLIKSEIIKNENGESEIWAELRPIAGTYKRGENASEDKILIEELLKDTKEIAEHVMLVDLGRNDLGRVCENGTIHLAENMVVEKYSHVLHIVSSVKGKLKKDISSIALLKACFPAGTLTGAPKVEAIKIISKLENEARGPYGGCLGYINLDGTINVAIVIRTIILEKHQASIQCGAGIVADSSPESEYQETFNKARALMEVLSTLA